MIEEFMKNYQRLLCDCLVCSEINNQAELAFGQLTVYEDTMLESKYLRGNILVESASRTQDGRKKEKFEVINKLEEHAKERANTVESLLKQIKVQKKLDPTSFEHKNKFFTLKPLDDALAMLYEHLYSINLMHVFIDVKFSKPEYALPDETEKPQPCLLKCKPCFEFSK
jgi:hypothetical protein